MTIPNVQSAYTRASGNTSTRVLLTIFNARAPTQYDIAYEVSQRWINTASNNQEYILLGFQTSQGVVTANWGLLNPGTGVLEFVEGNSGGAVGPNASSIINVLGDTTTIVTTGTPASNTLTITSGPTVATTYTEQTGTATPASGNLNISGSQGLTTSGSGHTVTITGTPTVAAGSSSLSNLGVASFNSADFTVDGNGFVSTIAPSPPPANVQSITIDAHTAPGTNPVVPTSGNAITITGGQVAASTTSNVIRTDSLAANAFTIEVQRSQAVASSTVGDNGVCHFNSTYFSVDSDGFVSFIGTSFGFTQINVQTFTSSGTYTPTSGMQYCIIEVVGGGGGGGGAPAGSSYKGGLGLGGGGGGYARGVYSTASIGASQTVTIGTGGSGGVGNSSGTGGGTTSVGSLLHATGGSGGSSGLQTAYAVFPGAAAGAGSGGSIQATGTPGTNGIVAIFDVVFTPIGGHINWGISGGGGSSVFGGGALPATAYVNPGNNGTAYGGGGSGAIALEAGPDQTGGNGHAGVVIITEFIGG